MVNVLKGICNCEKGAIDILASDAEITRTETLDNVRQLEQRQAQLQADAIQLKDSQLALIEQLKKCCKNDAALKLLVRAGVQEQLAAVSLVTPHTRAVGMHACAPTQSYSSYIAYLLFKITKP